MISKSKDSDIVTTSTVMSLKCPLSAMRMTLPCRSTICNHNQCFDAESFLQLQEQAPQWSCPTCNKVFNFDALVIDGYVQDILHSTSKSTEQVTIEPNGVWRSGAHESDSSASADGSKKKAAFPSWESEDLIEITDLHSNMVKPEPVSTPNPFESHFQPFYSRETSTAATSANRSTPGKRQGDNVIDLTLSSDEDEDPPRRPVKRQSTAGNYTPGLPSKPSQDTYPLPHRQVDGGSFSPYPLPSPGLGQDPGFGRYWGS